MRCQLTQLCMDCMHQKHKELHNAALPFALLGEAFATKLKSLCLLRQRERSKV